MGIISDFVRAIQSGNVSSFLLSFCISLLALFPALILHECAHGRVAQWCGDDTAKLSGRLSLNPMAHLDLWGTLSMLFIGFGWAKPVPVNPWNFKNRRRDSIFVSLAGIITNFLLFLFSMLMCVLLAMIIVRPEASDNMFYYKAYGLTRADVIRDYAQGMYYVNGLKHITQAEWLHWFILYFKVFAVYNISLAVFNFLPIPPLDGYRFWNAAVFNNRLVIDERIIFGIIVGIFVLNRATGILDTGISAVTGFFTSGVTNLIYSIFGL